MKIKALEFYGTPAAADAQRRLSDCTAALDAFAARVFDIEQQSRPAARGELASRLVIARPQMSS